MSEIPQVQPLDSFVAVRISSDYLKATLQVTKTDGWVPCTTEDLIAFIQSKGVTHGLKIDTIEKIVLNPFAYVKGPTLIAIGDLAQPGKDGRVELTLDAEQEAEQPQNRFEQAKVDYRKVITLRNVKKDEVIARRIPATDGIPGKTVSGIAVVAKRGKEMLLKAGKNVQLSEDHYSAIATSDGLVTLTGNNVLNVLPTYEVKGDVDYHVGDIDFVGNVVIKGSVLAGFQVKSGGDITVHGVVESAILEAAGSIEIKSGILGGYKGHVKAGRSLKTTFIQDANVTVGTDLIVTQSILHSEVAAGQDILCAQGTGLIIGGNIRAGQTVIARTIGNEMSAATVIEVGMDPELRAELLELRRNVFEWEANLDKIGKAVTLLQQMAAAHPLPEAKADMLQKLEANQLLILADLEGAQHRLAELEEVTSKIVNARVDVIDEVYIGTKIILADRTKNITIPTQHMRFQLRNDTVAMIPL